MEDIEKTSYNVNILQRQVHSGYDVTLVLSMNLRCKLDMLTLGNSSFRIVLEKLVARRISRKCD